MQHCKVIFQASTVSGIYFYKVEKFVRVLSIKAVLIIQFAIICPDTFPQNPVHTKYEGKRTFYGKAAFWLSDQVGVRMQFPILYNEEQPVQISVDYAL